MKLTLKSIPNLITLIRFPAAVGLIWDAKDGTASALFLPLFIVAAASDGVDGFLARKLKATSVTGALIDGYADIALYTACLISACLIYPDILKQYALGLIGLIFIQLVSWGFSLIKFGKMTSYHTYSAKVWGIMAVLSFIVLFGFNSGIIFPFMILAGFICNTEEILMTNILPYWKAGVLHYQMAKALRDEFNKTTKNDHSTVMQEF